jgi:hypothetical protein
MITVRKAQDRGHTAHGGWLESAHTFSFGDYFDTRYQGFGNLRVINDDTVAPGGGFGTHGHRDMEIISYVLDGQLAHKDSMGNGHAGSGVQGIIQPGDVQRMSAGTGVMHSEFNHSQSEPVHFLQIWILPKFRGIRPGYEQKHFAPEQRRGTLVLVASPDGAQGSITMNADARLYAGLFDGDASFAKPLAAGRLAYVHLARGQLSVNGVQLQAGDGAFIENEAALHLDAARQAEVLVFDLAP